MPPSNSLAVDLADEIDRHLVAVLRRRPRPPSRHEGRLRSASRLTPRRSRSPGRRRRGARSRRRRSRRPRSSAGPRGRRQGEIGLGLESLLKFRLVLREIDLRRAGRPQGIVLDDLAVGLVDGLLHRPRPSPSGHRDGADAPTGTLPGRKPLIAPWPASRGAEPSTRGARSLAGSTTLYSRFRPSSVFPSLASASFPYLLRPRQPKNNLAGRRR